VKTDAVDTVDPALLQRMTDALAHRGPDDSGCYVEPGVGLGHRRLSIIDIAGGKQPIFNEDRSAAIVFNGEIYNYKATTEGLIARGHRFTTRSDTETIIHAYEEYGDRCIERLRGMFAFAIWDRKRRRLLLARDRLGKKPLYYYQGPGFFAFASEIKALLEIPEVPREVDREALDLYLSLRYVPGPRTMFRDVFKLQPGHLLVLDSGGARTQVYWDALPESSAQPPVDAVAEFRERFEESVKLRLISEAPLGVFLSGGVDSSAVLAMMRKLEGGMRLQSFSIGYEAGSRGEAQSNELPFAAQAAAAFDAEHHEYRLSPSDFRELIPRLVWHLDEPLADPSCVPLYFLARLAREHITVALSGEGADEILAGYGIYRRMLALETLRRRFSTLAWLAPRLAPLAPGNVLRNYLLLAALPQESRYRGVSRALAPGAKARLLGRSDDSLLDSVFDPLWRRTAHASPLDRMLYLDLKIWLPDDLLLKADRMTMASGLELRVPFLDQEVVEYAFSLSDEWKLHEGRGKHLLRQAMSGVLPPAILQRPKKGFPVPTEVWLRNQMRDFTRDALLGPDSACRRHMDSAALEEVVSANERGEAGRHQDVWTLLVFEFWHRVFIDRARC
jgi:asparagine synthase (glutamine-hydrolysing)